MVMEVCCGQCQGRLLIETPGVIVACPHCGVHLSIPAPETADIPDPVPTRIEPEQELLPPFEPMSFPPRPNATETPAASSPTEISRGTDSPATVGTSAAFQSHSSIFHLGPDEHPEPASAAPTGEKSSPLTSVADRPAIPDEVTSTALPASNPIAAREPPNFSWMSSASEALDPSSPAESLVAASPIPGSTGADVNSSDRQDPALANNTDIVAVAATDPALAVAIAASPVSQQTSSSPDFSWMHGANTAPPVESVPTFGFGISNDPGEHMRGQTGTSVPGNDEPPAESDDPAIRFGNESLPSGVDPFNQQTGVAAAGGFALSSVTTTAAPPNDNFAAMSPHASAATSPGPVASDSRQAFLLMLLIAIGSYASLVTIYLVYVTIFGKANNLESLPDLKTVQQKGSRPDVRPKHVLPPGHDLKLGQTQRFGDIRVTPLRVTRGPMAFTHFTADATRKRDPTEPVLKLWLRFENVSDSRSITPIDTTLMFFRGGMADASAYNVIFREAERANKEARFFYHFDRMAADSEWLISGQHTNEALSPHQSFETFVPSEENIEGLTGDLVWRVHVRKGYGSQTGNGVTTLIDVRFNSADIKPDSV